MVEACEKKITKYAKLMARCHRQGQRVRCISLEVEGRTCAGKSCANPLLYLIEHHWGLQKKGPSECQKSRQSGCRYQSESCGLILHGHRHGNDHSQPGYLKESKVKRPETPNGYVLSLMMLLQMYEKKQKTCCYLEQKTRNILDIFLFLCLCIYFIGLFICFDSIYKQ